MGAPVAAPSASSSSSAWNASALRAGEWAYVEAESTETKLVFHRGAAPAKKAAAAKKGRAEGASPARGRKAAKK